MDEMRIDSHKLIYHVDRVNDWLKGKPVYPISIEIAPTNLCNHKCFFCGLDYRAKRSDFINKEELQRFIKEAKDKGLRALILAGEGEPLLNKDVPDIVAFTKKLGIDVAMTTNAIFMDKAFCEKALKFFKWVRVSIDAGTPETYALMHKTRKEDFYRVIDNLKTAVAIKKRDNLSVTIGAQFLLLKENYKDVEIAARLLKKIGVDYLIIKPYSKHPLSKNRAGEDIDYSRFMHLEKKLRRYSGNGFSIIFRRPTMEKRFRKKPYDRCLGTPFWAYLSADGELYPCSTFYGLKRFSFGNIKNKGFVALWNGKRRKNILRFIEKKMDVEKCRELCRLDEINKYLWRLKHPHLHENFI